MFDLLAQAHFALHQDPSGQSLYSWEDQYNDDWNVRFVMHLPLLVVLSPS